MISIGNSITSAYDTLQKVELGKLASRIRQPKPEFISFINQLRNVCSIEPSKYRQLKTRLPYVVAAIFNPPFRKIENFAYTRYFILDIDHLTDKGIDINTLFNKLKANPAIVLMFRSPSADGVKIFFKLEEKCFDAAKYSLFYKVFAKKFAADYGLAQVIDKRTSDVSRACFVSYDPDAWYNQEAQPISVARYVDFENQLQMMDLQKMLKEENSKIENKTHHEKTEIPQDVWQDIREKLNPRLREKREKNLIVPKELDAVLNNINQTLQNINVEIESVTNINYGKKIRVKTQGSWAEVNVFYGKKGFSVVGTPKNGSNKALMETVRLVLLDLLI